MSLVMCVASASSQIGLGHIMRCHALAEEFVRRGYQVLWHIPTAQQGFVNSLGYDKLSCFERLSFESIYACIREHQPVLVMIDSFKLSVGDIQRINATVPSLVFDDMNNRGKFTCAALINSSDAALSFDYFADSSESKAFLGKQFHCFRDEFLAFPQGEATGERILIMMGGSDPAGLTLPTVKALVSRLGEQLPLDVVCGAANPMNEDIKVAFEQMGLRNSRLHINSQSVAQLMAQAKLAISAAGGSLFELCLMGVPSLLVVVADNQVKSAQQEASLPWCDAVFSQDPQEIALKAEAMYRDEAWLQQAREYALTCTNGKGKEKIVDYVEKDLFS